MCILKQRHKFAIGPPIGPIAGGSVGSEHAWQLEHRGPWRWFRGTEIKSELFLVMISSCIFFYSLPTGTLVTLQCNTRDSQTRPCSFLSDTHIITLRIPQPKHGRNPSTPYGSPRLILSELLEWSCWADTGLRGWVIIIPFLHFLQGRPDPE